MWFPDGSLVNYYPDDETKALKVDAEGKVIKGTKEVRSGGNSGKDENKGYHITYSANTTESYTGTLPTDPASYKANDKVTVSAASISRKDYDFVGWNTKPDGTGTTYKENDTFTIKEDITLYAIWKLKDNKPNPPVISVSDNKPMEYKEEERGEFKIGYYSAVPFWGKAKPSVTTFGSLTVSGNNGTYEVTKIKVNKKKGLIQITGLSGADKSIVKKIKESTKGAKGLSFTINPYFVRDTDTVNPKTKKDGSLKSIKIKISEKDYKAKNDEWTYDSGTRTITFTGKNLNGSYKLS